MKNYFNRFCCVMLITFAIVGLFYVVWGTFINVRFDGLANTSPMCYIHGDFNGDYDCTKFQEFEKNYLKGDSVTAASMFVIILQDIYSSLAAAFILFILLIVFEALFEEFFKDKEKKYIITALLGVFVIWINHGTYTSNIITMALTLKGLIYLNKKKIKGKKNIIYNILIIFIAPLITYLIGIICSSFLNGATDYYIFPNIYTYTISILISLITTCIYYLVYKEYNKRLKNKSKKTRKQIKTRS